MSSRRVELVLALGALAGLAMAGLGILESEAPPPRGVPEDAVATVDGRAITVVQYRRALAAMASDRREQQLDDELRQHVLERLIDEELLVQRGLELGLSARDPRVRADLGSAVIGLITARAETRARAPDQATLRGFYERQRGFFARPPRVRVQQAWFVDRAGAEAGRTAWQAGEPVTWAPAPVPVPDGLLPAPKLRDYLGPTATRWALAAHPGEVSEVMPAVGGFRVLRLLERQEASERDLDDIRELVQAEYVRRSGERAVRRFLQQRRARARIAVAEERL